MTCPSDPIGQVKPHRALAKRPSDATAGRPFWRSNILWFEVESLVARFARCCFDAYRIGHNSFPKPPPRGTIDPMLMPQFTTRFLLLLTAAAAFVFLIISLAFRGHIWAAGLTGVFFAVAITFAIHAASFGIAWTLSFMWRGSASESESRTPFASAPAPADGKLEVRHSGSESQAASIE